MTKVKVLSLALICGLVIWFADSLADYLIFYSGNSFIDLLILSPPGHEIYIRILIVLLILGFGFVAYRWIRREEEHSTKLSKALKEREIELDKVEIDQTRAVHWDACEVLRAPEGPCIPA